MKIPLKKAVLKESACLCGVPTNGSIMSCSVDGFYMYLDTDLGLIVVKRPGYNDELVPLGNVETMTAASCLSGKAKQ